MSDHYFSAQPGGAFERKQVTARVWDHDLAFTTGSGVFAHGRLDIGTSVLFRETGPPHADGTFLDLGSGYGAIACAIASAVNGADVWAVDVNERALELCRDNAAANGSGDRIHAATPDLVPADLSFDEIWSNPPIRIGKKALHDLLLQWLPRLHPGGRAVLVVGKNLGADSLQRWLWEQGFECDRLASAKGFRVLEVRPTEPK